MKNTTIQVLWSLFLVTVLASCGRPTAYFQPTSREHFTQVNKPVAPVVTPVAQESTPVAVATPAEQVAQASATLDKVDALVRNDNKLAADKTVQKRLSKVRTLLANASAKMTLTPQSTTAPKKMSLVQRLMVKQMNHKIAKSFAPEKTKKAMAIKGILALGAVILIAGLIILLVSPAGSTGITIGIIGLVAGLALLLIGLI